MNTILISPRRMGKSSLVDKVCSLVESEDIRIARIDAFGCRSENDSINALPQLWFGLRSSKGKGMDGECQGVLEPFRSENQYRTRSFD